MHHNAGNGKAESNQIANEREDEKKLSDERCRKTEKIDE
jgi:hypothetical protein